MKGCSLAMQLVLLLVRRLVQPMVQLMDYGLAHVAEPMVLWLEHPAGSQELESTTTP